jgi:hypothetical protein
MAEKKKGGLVSSRSVFLRFTVRGDVMRKLITAGLILGAGLTAFGRQTQAYLNYP